VKISVNESLWQWRRRKLKILSTGEEEVAISKAAIVKINKAAPASMKAA
jgi:hypothetical protein